MKHLTEHQVAGFLDHALPPDERRLVEEHLEACPDCRHEMVTFHRMLPDLRKAAGRSSWRARWWIPAALAAGLALIWIVPGTLGRGSGSPSSIRAPAADGERQASIPIVAPADDVITKTPVIFTWRAASADLYRLVILADDGHPIWSGETADTSLTLPNGVALASGHSYFWRVDAIANGIVASSGIQRLTIEP